MIKKYQPCGVVAEMNPGLSQPNGWTAKDMVAFFDELGYEAYSCHLDGHPRDPNFGDFNAVGQLRDALWLPRTPLAHCSPK
jgi:hypothetical protein